MTNTEVASKTRKIIKMHKDEYIINTVYFNPAFLMSVVGQVSELAEGGIHASVTETETTTGTLLEGVLRSPKRTLSLGSVLLDGEEIVIKQRLTSVDKIVAFIEQELVFVES